MKTKKFIPTIILVLVLILELLPYGAVCNFANPEGEPWRETFSYFDLIPLGYANIGPFITAVLTCVMLVLSVLYLLKSITKILSILKVITVIAIITSVLPLIFGLNFYSVAGGAISCLLVAEYIVLMTVKQ